ncbi:MAG: hypothetical protein ACT4N2_11710 [Hyphomicrobium sp.]
MSRPRHLVLLIAGTVFLSAAAMAEDKPVSTATPQTELTTEEKAERDSRKACKVAICDAFHNRKPGPDVACKVVKSFRKTQLEKMVSKAKVSWPWGRVVCTSDVRLKRDLLLKALVADKLVAEFDSHKVSCTVEREKDGAAEITAEFTPKVTFEKGKAVKASLNWGKVDGPTVIKGALWTATAADNTIGVLQSTIVDDVNDFTSKKCDEVKPEWAGK